MVRFPSTVRSPWWELSRRLVLAIAILVGTVLLVYLDRDGYRDNSDPPGFRVGFIDSIYYTTVTLSTTGYGDIAPFTPGARLVNAFVITPLRIAFLVLLIGTTLEVLASQGREQFRVARWRKKMDDHVVVIGYGTKGRSAVELLLSNGVDKEKVVVVDPGSTALEDANADGLAVVAGDATRREVLRRAGVDRASQVIITTGRDDSTVLSTLTVAPAQPRRLHRRRGAGVRQRAAGQAERCRLGGHLVRRGRPAARAVVPEPDPRRGDGGPADARRGTRGRGA